MKNQSNTKNMVISLILALFWLSMTSLYIFSSDVSFTVTSYFHKVAGLQLENNRVNGVFTAAYDNLGILSIPLYSSGGNAIFRIKEKRTNNWEFVHSFDTPIAEQWDYFPIGFPTIENSKGKTYEFQIATKGKNSNISLSSKNFYSKYQTPKEEILRSPTNIFQFLIHKVYNNILYFNLLPVSFIYALPLLFYLSWPHYISRKVTKPIQKRLLYALKKGKKRASHTVVRNVFGYLELFVGSDAAWILLIVIIIDILLLQSISTIIILIMMYLLFSLPRSSTKRYFAVSGVFLTMSFVLTVIHQLYYAEKVLVWFFAFLVVGTIYYLVDIRHEYRKTS